MKKAFVGLFLLVSFLFVDEEATALAVERMGAFVVVVV
jgi:hypothetical protein